MINLKKMSMNKFIFWIVTCHILHICNRRFGTSKMHLSPPVAWAAVPSKAVVLLLLIYCLMYFPLFVGVLCLICFVMHCFVSILVLQSS